MVVAPLRDGVADGSPRELPSNPMRAGIGHLFCGCFVAGLGSPNNCCANLLALQKKDQMTLSFAKCFQEQAPFEKSFSGRTDNKDESKTPHKTHKQHAPDDRHHGHPRTHTTNAQTLRHSSLHHHFLSLYYILFLSFLLYVQFHCITRSFARVREPRIVWS